MHHFDAHCLIYFLVMTLLAMYFIFILDYGNVVGQRANLSYFLEFKMGHKAAETSCHINHAFGPGTANIQCSGGSRSFLKETRTLEMRSAVADHRKWTTTNGEQLLKLILL